MKGTAGHILEHGNTAQQLGALVCARLWEGVGGGGRDGRGTENRKGRGDMTYKLWIYVTFCYYKNNGSDFKETIPVWELWPVLAGSG